MSKTIFAALIVASIACSSPKQDKYDSTTDSLRFQDEKYIRNIKQLTFGGNNAEAYFSFDNKQLVFQSDWSEINDQGCDQIYTMSVSDFDSPLKERYKLVSTGKGRTTCSFFLKDGRIVFGSTHAADEACPKFTPFAGGRYVWPIHDTYDIYVADGNGENMETLIGGEGYDAEATASPDGKYIIFTSTRSGDLELWRYEIASGDLLQLTSELGYDGGAFFSSDSKKIVWRASRPTGKDATVYKDLLKQGLVEPKALNIFIADIDGSNVQQITDLPGANWAPFFHPSGKKILFSSNHHTIAKGGREFDIFMINVDGSGLEKITNSGTFDAFPMFSYDGKMLVFSSNRRADRKEDRATNVFIADWID